MNWKLWILAVVLLLGGPVFAFNSYKQQRTHEKLEASGKTVPAVIEGGSETKRRKSGRSYHMDISWTTADNKPMQKSFSVTSEFFKAHTSGNNLTDDHAEICYDPEHPEEAIVVGGTSKPTPMPGLLMAVGGIAMGGFGLLKRRG